MSRLTNAGCLLYFIQEQPKEAAYVQSMWPISRHGGDSPLTGRWFYTGLNGFKFWCGKNNQRVPFSFEKGVSHQEDCNSEAKPLHWSCSCTHPKIASMPAREVDWEGIGERSRKVRSSQWWFSNSESSRSQWQRLRVLGWCRGVLEWVGGNWREEPVSSTIIANLGLWVLNSRRWMLRDVKDILERLFW